MTSEFSVFAPIGRSEMMSTAHSMPKKPGPNVIEAMESRRELRSSRAVQSSPAATRPRPVHCPIMVRLLPRASVSMRRPLDHKRAVVPANERAWWRPGDGRIDVQVILFAGPDPPESPS
jgi:putative SOS response-associated peptidase YedK